MTIPDYQTLMRPLLSLVHERGEIALRDARAELAKRLALTDEELSQRIPSGYTTVWMSRVHWSKTYLSKAGAIDSPRRGVIRSNARTEELLALDTPIGKGTLFRYAEFRAWLSKAADEDGTQETDAASVIGALETETPPLEALEAAHRQLRQETTDDLLERVQVMDPTAFEKLVLQLLRRLGYGGPFGSAEHLGKTGDGGVDGLIKEDRLGLDRVYLQAKRWTNNVGAPEIQAFVGSLVGHQADRGVFITTSGFSTPAHEYVSNIAHRVVLIDGARLAELMWDTGLGLSTVQTYEVKAIDSDFFDNELS